MHYPPGSVIKPLILVQDIEAEKYRRRSDKLSRISRRPSNLGSGTMVYSNRYGGIRAMTMNDISDVLRIMRPFVDKGILLPRSEAQLEEKLQDFIVFEVDDSVHACAALHEFPEKVGEIAGISVDEHFLHLGVGPKLVDFLCERARRRGLSSVFVLTTQTADWFQKLGFTEADPAS